jgi:hypothetical protein
MDESVDGDGVVFCVFGDQLLPPIGATQDVGDEAALDDLGEGDLVDLGHAPVDPVGVFGDRQFVEGVADEVWVPIDVVAGGRRVAGCPERTTPRCALIRRRFRW